MPILSDDPRRCAECRREDSEPIGEVNEWDFYYRTWKCNGCKNTWSVGNLKTPPRNPRFDPITIITSETRSKEVP